MQNRGAQRLKKLVPRGQQKILARRLGVSTACVSRWKSGARKPTAQHRISMMRYTGIALADWDRPVRGPA